MKMRPYILAGVAGLGLAACQQPIDPQVAGVGAGAATGALAGQLIGGDTRSTIIGAGVGGIAGGIAGTEVERQQQQRIVQQRAGQPRTVVIR